MIDMLLLTLSAGSKLTLWRKKTVAFYFYSGLNDRHNFALRGMPPFPAYHPTFDERVSQIKAWPHDEMKTTSRAFSACYISTLASCLSWIWWILSSNASQQPFTPPPFNHCPSMTCIWQTFFKSFAISTSSSSTGSLHQRWWQKDSRRVDRCQNDMQTLIKHGAAVEWVDRQSQCKACQCFSWCLLSNYRAKAYSNFWSTGWRWCRRHPWW